MWHLSRVVYQERWAPIKRNAGIRIPADFKRFLANGNNKERLIELVEEVWKQELQSFQSDGVVYFARKHSCTRITREGSFQEIGLTTNHEEADTKISYSLHHACEENGAPETTCVQVLLTLTYQSFSWPMKNPTFMFIWIMAPERTGKFCPYHPASCHMPRKRLFSGYTLSLETDYISSFMRKGKKAFWQIVKNNGEFLTLFGNLGTENRPSQQWIDSVEIFCCLYGEKCLDCVNEARKSIFWKNFEPGEKVTDLSLLPPCKSSRKNHSPRKLCCKNLATSKKPNLGNWRATRSWMEWRLSRTR